MGDSESPAIQSDERSDSQGHLWSSSQTAAIILLAAVCTVFVWNAYHPEDIYLSDLKYETPISDRLVPQNDRSASGDTLAIHETYYPKGIGVHANSEIHLRFLPNQYKFFVTEVGIDKAVPADSGASVIFQILCDGTVMYESPVMKPGMPPRYARVCIEGRNTLALKVTDAGDGNEADHANWAMARFVAR